MVPLPVKTVVHRHAKPIYEWGEHGCAAAYALHEVFHFEALVVPLSGLLITGVLVIIVDLVIDKL